MTIASPEIDARVQASLDRVARHYPLQSRGHIDEILRGGFAALADKPIRIYISNLVEHNTRNQLSREGAHT